MESSKNPSPSRALEGFIHRINALKISKDLENSIPNGDVINNLYNELNSYVMKLDRRVGEVLKKHEKDCLDNYRSKMYAIQKEMRLLKDRANEEENNKRKAQKIKELELQRNKLKDKAEALDKVCKEQKRSLDTWKIRAEEMIDDKKFYEEQLEAAKKQQEVLREQLKNIENNPEPQQNSVENPSFNKVQALNTSSSNNYFNQVSNRLKETIGHLYSQLEIERKNLRGLKNAKTNYLLEKGELEDLFLVCVEDVKREIFARKMKATRVVGKMKKITEKERNVDFSEFKEIDKRKVMENFLNSEKVRRFLYEKMFNKQPEDQITLEKSEKKSHRSLTKSRSSSKPSTSNGLLSRIFSKARYSPEPETKLDED
jgi:chromosome segregation ATPase